MQKTFAQDVLRILPGAGLLIAGTLVFWCLPLFVAAARDSLNLSESEQGLFAALDVVGVALAGLLSLLWVRRVSWKRMATLGLVVFILANVTSFFVESFALQCTLRFIAGLGAGTAYSVSLGWLGSMPDPDRAIGIAIGIQLLFAAVAILVVNAAVEAWGFNGVLVYLAGTATLLLPCLIWVPQGAATASAQAESVSATVGWSQLASAGAIFPLFAGVAAVWAFAERMGSLGGLDLNFIATALSASLAISCVGSFAAAWLTRRIGLRFAILLGLGLTAACIPFLAFPIGDAFTSQYLLAACLFQVSWNLAGPLVLIALAYADPHQRLLTTSTFLQGAGSAVGPAVGGFAIAGGDMSMLVVLGITSMVVCALLILPGTKTSHPQHHQA